MDLSHIPLSLNEILIVNAITAVGAMLQGSVGFGWAIVAAPVFLLIEPALVPGPILFATLFLVVMIFYKDRQEVDLKGLKAAIIGRIPGTILGVMILKFLPVRPLSILIAVLIMLSVLVSICNFRLKPTPKTLFSAGAIAGFTGTTAAVGGPPIALVYQHEKGATIRATLSGYFFVGSTMSIFFMWLVGKFGSVEIFLSLCILPGIYIGYFLTKWASKILKDKYIRPAILVFSTVAAIVVIIKNAI